MNHLRPALIVLLFTTVVAPFANSQVVKFRDEVDAAEASQPAEVDPTGKVSGTVKLNLRGNVELKALVEYIGRRLGISFVYDDEIAGKRVNVRAPEEVPVRSLMEILGSVLKMEGMILVEADTPGWLRIVSASEMARLSSPDGDGPLRNPATPITQMFSLENAKPQTLISLLDPFLTGPDSNVFGIEETGTLVVTDYPSVVENVGLLIRMLDKGRGETKIRYYRVQHASVDALVEKVQEALNSTSAKLIGLTDTQVVAVVGVQPQLDQAVEFLERFDVPVDRTVKVHRFKNIRAERVQAILEGMLDGETWARYTVTADRDANLLVVRAASDVHTLFDDIIQQLDQPTENPRHSAAVLQASKCQGDRSVLYPADAATDDRGRCRVWWLRRWIRKRCGRSIAVRHRYGGLESVCRRRFRWWRRRNIRGSQRGLWRWFGWWIRRRQPWRRWFGHSRRGRHEPLEHREFRLARLRFWHNQRAG